MATISIPYGDEYLRFDVSDERLLDILNPNESTLPSDELEEIRHAIEEPIGSHHLEDIVSPDDIVALICDDISRSTPTDKVLAILLNLLNDAGVPDEKVFAVMALGSHRPMTDEEITRKVGPETRSRIAVFNSEFRQEDGLLDLGLAPGGVRIWADKRVMSANIRIGIGSIAPHPAVGWSGGGKIIYPGVTGERTVTAFHLQHGSVPWNMYGSERSPVRENMEKWVDKVGLHFIINLVCTPSGRIYRAVAGHYVDAHRAGVKHAKKLYGVEAQGRAEIAIVSSHPADADFWQATKGVLSGDFLVKDGGTLILVTPCFEGVGPHSSYMTYIGSSNIEELLAEASLMTNTTGDPLALPVAATVARVRQRIMLALVSEGITHEDALRAGFYKYDTIECALEDAFARHGPSAKVSVLPYGAVVYPILPEDN